MEFARHKPIATYLTVVYLLAAVVFLPPLLGTAGLGILPFEIPVAPFLLISTAALAGVAFAVTAAADGRPGVRELRKRAFRFRVSLAWYAVALLALPLAALGFAIVTQGTVPLDVLAADPNVVTSWATRVVIAVVLINFWEELGWTGFVLHRLQPRVGPLRATVLTTFAQGAFHLPLLFIVGGVSDVRLSPDQYPFILFALFVFPLGNRTVLTWLYNNTRYSLPLAGLMHASWNLATGPEFLPTLFPGYDEIWAYAGFAVLAVALIAATRGRLGYDRTVIESRTVTGAEPQPASVAS